MYPRFAKNGLHHSLHYRLNHIEGAYKKARGNHYEGAMWPWESAYTGDEVTWIDAADTCHGYRP